MVHAFTPKPDPSILWTHKDRINRGRKGHKNQFLAYVYRFSNSCISQAAPIQLLLNPNILRANFSCSLGRDAQSMYVMSMF